MVVVSLISCNRILKIAFQPQYKGNDFGPEARRKKTASLVRSIQPNTVWNRPELACPNMLSQCGDVLVKTHMDNTNILHSLSKLVKNIRMS